MIRVEHLHKYYNKGKQNEQHVLNDMSLELGETGLVCILGESGSGKTTLLNTMGGLDTFSGGEITINDVSVSKYDPAVIEPIRNDHFGYIFQNYYLLQDYSVAYNVKLALNRYDLTEEEKDERTEYVLSMLGMSKYKKKLVSKLSGGQQQRVSIARALVKAPDIIMADEPTGNLDEENTLRTMSILKSISKTCLVLVVTHEKRIAQFFADEIIEVSDGKILRHEPNQSTSGFERVDDANIYLKEMECRNLESEFATFKMYHEPGDVPQEIKLNFAWRDGKLYIQNLMGCDVLLEGSANAVLMLNEERPKIKMEDVENISYQLDPLKSSKKGSLTPKEIWKMAVENIRLMGKKQGFIVAILVVTAILLSATVAQFADSIIIDETYFVSTDSHYVKLDFTKVSSMRGKQQQWDILEYVWKYLDDGKSGEVFFSPDVNIYLQGQGLMQTKELLQGIDKYCFVDKKHLKEEQLLYGRMPKKRGEIVVDIQVIRNIIRAKGVVSSAYESIEDYVGARFYVATMKEYLDIVGISNSGQPDIYLGQNVLVGMLTKGYSIASVTEARAEDENAIPVSSLADDEMLMREGLLKSLQAGDVGDDHEVAIGKPYKMGDDTKHLYTIAGVIPDSLGVDYVFSDKGCRNIRDLMIYVTGSCLVYSDQMEETLEKLMKNAEGFTYSFRLNLTELQKEEIKEYRKEHSADFGAKGLITAVIALVAIVMIYFTMKSNAISRMEELVVYRLVGITRGSILKAYILEMALLTCYTSLPAVLVSSGVIKFISSIPSLEIHMMFPWWCVVGLLAVLYLVNIGISILPVFGILKRPPAMLAVKE